LVKWEYASEEYFSCAGVTLQSRGGYQFTRKALALEAMDRSLKATKGLIIACWDEFWIPIILRDTAGSDRLVFPPDA
jgi:hypothetical protein